MDKTKLTNEEFVQILQHPKDINWVSTFNNYIFTEAQMRCVAKYIDNFGWIALSMEQELSQNFIRNFRKKVDWTAFDYNKPIFTLSFIREMEEYVCWNAIFEFKKDIDKDFEKEFYNKIWHFAFSDEDWDKC